MRTATGYRAVDETAPLERWTFDRRDLRDDDVAVRVTYCGVCHTDLHSTRNPGDFPVVPGHEFVGEVTEIGSGVTDFAVGDAVAVGNIVDSCGRCDMCTVGQENFCREFPTLTYGGRDRHDGTTTRGAYSNEYVVRDRFVYHRPDNLDPAAVAPLMCAGITVWEPLRRWNVGPGVRLGIAGIGGLGHLAVKLGRALGAEVTVLTTSANKVADAQKLGAHHVVVSTDDAAMNALAGGLDLIIDCVPVEHDLAPYLRCLALDGTLCTVGYLGSTTVDFLDLLIGRKSLASAGSGGRRYTQDLLDFCGEHGIVADVETMPSAQVNNAFDRLAANDVRYRFVLDMSDLRSQPM
ncbi:MULTISPECIES: NAD(P)-dependent alcohol dehydrogenase [Nocardiaceae]|uniref:NAD(P)-dependent alcohol dehydrogenase n=1 Tax=Nocardiaceae TaxID=85025 RepID=UPI00050C7988|nr:MULTISPECIES: NAD(P)-dependent alcohol dehydrogenase [Rhodococcus]OZC49738.1 NAD(P)-dependent alcohol dehydrogenase [Rhodococcus sp. WWJCD1]